MSNITKSGIIRYVQDNHHFKPFVKYNRTEKAYYVYTDDPDVKNSNAVFLCWFFGSDPDARQKLTNAINEIREAAHNEPEPETVASEPEPVAPVKRQSKAVGKKPAIPTNQGMNLTLAITLVGQLYYDTLRDVRDLLEYKNRADDIEAAADEREREKLRSTRNRIKLRIRGRHSTRDGGGKSWDELTYPDGLTDVPTMDKASREALLATVKALIQAKQPKAAQRTKADGSSVARGSFQVKTKKDYFIVRDLVTGEIMRDPDGNAIKKDAHYLYFRLYITNQDGTKRSASIYIGSMNRNEPKPFYAAVRAAYDAETNGQPIEDWMITRDDLIQRFERGGYEAVKEWRNEMDEGIE